MNLFPFRVGHALIFPSLVVPRVVVVLGSFAFDKRVMNVALLCRMLTGAFRGSTPPRFQRIMDIWIQI